MRLNLYNDFRKKVFLWLIKKYFFQMGDLELRNNELFNEITWLKQQMGNYPMVMAFFKQF